MGSVKDRRPAAAAVIGNGEVERGFRQTLAYEGPGQPLSTVVGTYRGVMHANTLTFPAHWQEWSQR